MFLPFPNSRYATGTRALSLVEVLVAVLILAIVVTGGVAFSTSGRTRVLRAGQQRAAAQIAMERLERARAAGYDGADFDYGTVTLDGTNYEWYFSAAPAIADPGDSESTYKMLQVFVTWPGCGSDSVVVNSALSP